MELGVDQKRLLLEAAMEGHHPCDLSSRIRYSLCFEAHIWPARKVNRSLEKLRRSALSQISFRIKVVIRWR